MFQLSGQDGRFFPIKENGVSIGRHSSNDLVVSDTQVSRLHARVFVSHGRCWVRDEHSGLGTYINGQRVPGQIELKPGQWLQIGSEAYQLQQVQEPVQNKVKGGMKKSNQMVFILLAFFVVAGGIILFSSTSGGGRDYPNALVPDSGPTISADSSEISSSGEAVGLDTPPDFSILDQTVYQEEENQVLSETTRQIEPKQEAVLNSGQASVIFSESALSQAADVTLTELGESDAVSGGIMVDLGGAELQEKVQIEFAAGTDLPSGALVPLVHSKDGGKTWEAAYYQDGSRVFGLVDEADQIITSVDHFSGIALSQEAARASRAYAAWVLAETKPFQLDNGYSVYLPYDLNPDAILKSGSLMGRFDDPLGILMGINDDNRRRERYKDVLVELFMQPDMIFDINDDDLDIVISHLGNFEQNFEVARDFYLSTELGRDALRNFRSEGLLWSKYARLDYVASRAGGFLDGVPAAMGWAGSAFVIGKDVYRAIIYQALSDEIVSQRMRDFDLLLSPRCAEGSIDPMLCAAFEDAEEAVNKRLDNAMLGLLDVIKENAAQNVKVATYVGVAIEHKSWMAIANMNPYVLATFVIWEGYDSIVLDTYANIQRASLAATISHELFASTESLAESPEALNQQMMRIYLSLIHYQKLDQPWANDAANVFLSWVITGSSRTVDIRRNSISNAISRIEEKYKELERERLLLLSSLESELAVVEPAETAEGDWEFYQDPQMGVSFEYPAGWVIQQDEEGIFVGEDEENFAFVVGRFSMDYFYEISGNEMGSITTSGDFSNLLMEDEDIRIEKRTSREFGGGAGVMGEIVVLDDEELEGGLIIDSLSEDDILTYFMGVFPAGRAEEYRLIFEHVIDSVE